MDRCLSPGNFFGKVVRRRVSAGLSFTETRHPARTRMPRHCHESAQFCLIRRGTFQQEYRGRQRSCAPDTLVFNPIHEMHAEQTGAEEVWSFIIEIAPDWARGLAGTVSALDQPFDCQGGPAMSLALRAFDEFQHFDASSPLIVEGLTLELLGVCDRQAKGEAVVPRWLRHVNERLRARCAESWSLRDIATEAGVHPGYLATAFRRHYGCTIGEFVRQERVARACRDLAGSDVPLADIASQAGFADQSHFTRTFKRQTGLTPAAYRKLTARTAKRSKS
jgi:AraC family transcriptional regulator